MQDFPKHTTSKIFQDQSDECLSMHTLDDFKPVHIQFDENIQNNLLDNFRVSKEMIVKILPGEEFDPTTICFHGVQSENKDFWVYQFKEL
jgi:cytochrome c oxidase assembly protein Cox11